MSKLFSLLLPDKRYHDKRKTSQWDLYKVKDKIDWDRLPSHIGIIMDGNGRWATRQGLPRLSGHAAGSRKAEEIVKYAKDTGINYITLYAFSTENWKRPKAEVKGLLKLLIELFEKRLEELMDYGAKIKVIGRRDRLPEDVLHAIIKVEEKTRLNSGIFVNIAIDYGGRDELKRVMQKLAQQVLEGKILPLDICENHISSYLDTASVPDPDLIIRTGGEMRISNFLIWQSAYSELVFIPKLWPDFQDLDFLFAILEYQDRDRRFGNL